MKKWLPYFFITFLYFVIISVFRQDALNFRFDHTLVDRYYHSQDITHEVSNRIFLSDADMYSVTGYLYVTGLDPILANFEHPPIIKYLFGLAILYFDNPLLIQILFGLLLVNLLYLFGTKMTGRWQIGMMASIFLIIDPLFISILGQSLLDLGQTFFMLVYMYYLFYDSDNWLAQGLSLALFFGSKFGAASIFFVIISTIYLWRQNKISKRFWYQFPVAFLGLALSYSRSYFLSSGHFSLVWQQLKIAKFFVQHSTASFFGASFILFFTSYWKTWWGTKSWTISEIWSLAWPIGLISGFIKPNIFTILPAIYLLFLGIQAPFVRYFLIILPFIYISLASTIISSCDWISSRKAIGKPGTLQK